MTGAELSRVDAEDADEVAVAPAHVVHRDTKVLGAPDEDVPMAVDPPAGKLTSLDLLGVDLSQRRMIVPKWLRSPAEARQVAEWLVRYVGHVVTFHITRAPKYAVKGVWQGVRGAAKVVWLFLAWLLDLETRGVMRDSKRGSTKDDRDRYDSLKRLWTKTVHQRVLITAGWSGTVLVTVSLASVWAPAWVAALVAVAVVWGLLWLGRDEDKPLFDRAVSEGAQPFRLTSKMIVTALGALGIANINAALKLDPKDGIRFPAPIREDGPGWKATVDLPHGVTAAMVMEKRSELASGLRRPLGCVWPESAPEVHAGRVVLWVGHQELSQMKPPKAPYVREDWRCDAFTDIPFGFDQRGKLIAFELMYGNLLIGALPGAGKTAAVRGLLLALALDPTVELRIAEHKGSGDLSMLEQCAHFYVSGVTDEDISATVQMLRDVLAEIERRAKVVKHLGQTSDLAPESKVTRQTASMRHLGLHPLVVVIDEAQELFTHDEHKAEAAKLAERGIKRGRAFGVIFIFATQRPDSKSVPTGVSGNVSHRFCLRVTGQVENDMILGTSAYKHGIQATTLSPRDKGVGYLKGAFDDAIVVRAHYQDKPTAERVANRATAIRRAAGTITGHAAGETFEPEPSYSLLDDLGTIFVASERLHSEAVCERLRELRPDAYADWTPTTLANALPEGLATAQVSIAGTNRRGLRRDQVLAAIGQREGIPQIGLGAS